MTYRAGLAAKSWSIPVRSTDGELVYVLTRTLEPDGDGNVAGLDIILKHPHDGPDALNLLAPAKNWHGMQAFIFAANDLVNGPAKSAYGQFRDISIPRLGLTVRITLVSAEVSPDGAGDEKLDKIQLKIEAKNTPAAN